MNYPQNQRTGRLAELSVERLFTSWSWTVGRDHIDTGYDFFVEPDVATFRGHRFLVQVKGTVRSKRGFVARVGRDRLRQYASNPLPIFLIWSSSEGVLHWLHIQAWIQRNERRLKGNGEAGVRMSQEQVLDDRDSFQAYLKEVFKPAAQSRSALPALAQERSSYLSSIDHRIGVRVGLSDGRECYEIYAKSENAEIGLELKLADDADNKRNFIEAVQYGVPVSVNVDLFRMNSEVFSAIGFSDSKGTVSIRPVSDKPVVATLYPGSGYSMLASAYSIKANLYRGQVGFAITNEGLDDVVEFRLLSENPSSTSRAVKVVMSLRSDVLASKPIQCLEALGVLGAWAYESMERKGVYLDLTFDQHRVSMRASGDAVDLLHPFFYNAYVMGRLHKVAKALNSSFIVDEEFTLTEAEVADLGLAYRLLKGERVNVDLGPLVFDTALPVALAQSGEFVVQTAIDLSLRNRPFGTVPVEISLKGYTLEACTDKPLKYRLVKGEGGSAILYFRSSELTLVSSHGDTKGATSGESQPS
ncbi:DUF4365 domain-containing protein [Thermomonas fusca]